MRPFEEVLQESAKRHGHLCPGQVLGRGARLGCRAVGIDEPASSRSLLVYVEIDRCATDAIQAVTGCKLGKRTLKFFDYGKMAATFANIDKNEAVRVVALDGSREAVFRYAPSGLDKRSAQLHAYRVMPEEELFAVTPVRVDVSPTDLPGHPSRRVACADCGEGINNGREITRQGRALCLACADGAYYRPLEPAIGPNGG